MTLVRSAYGKARVRVLRVRKEGGRHEVRELTVRAMLEGAAFGRSYTDADNAAVVATDSIKNIVNVTARERLDADNETFARTLARRFLERYPQVERAGVACEETAWRRLFVDGDEHPHGFAHDGNGRPFARATADRDREEVESGVTGFTFMKTTGSGWADFVTDEFTTLAATDDRVCATSLDASWPWRGDPADYRRANALILDAMLKVFLTTYSHGVQDSLYRMATAALEAVPEVREIRLAAPNKHYIPIDLAPFGLDNPNAVFLPTDEPHGQIECVVGR